MFGSLTERLGAVFDRLRKKGALSESDVADALRDVRVALLEADVALPVVKDFIAGSQFKQLKIITKTVLLRVVKFNFLIINKHYF